MTVVGEVDGDCEWWEGREVSTREVKNILIKDNKLSNKEFSILDSKQM